MTQIPTRSRLGLALCAIGGIALAFAFLLLLRETYYIVTGMAARIGADYATPASNALYLLRRITYLLYVTAHPLVIGLLCFEVAGGGAPRRFVATAAIVLIVSTPLSLSIDFMISASMYGGATLSDGSLLMHGLMSIFTTTILMWGMGLASLALLAARSNEERSDD